MKKMILLISLFSLWIFYGIYVAFFDWSPWVVDLLTLEKTKFYDYKGVIHVLSQRSLGSGSISRIVRAAQSKNFDFLILTDMQIPPVANPENIQGYHQDLLVIDAQKWNFLDSRVLELGSERKYFENLGDLNVYLSDRLSQDSKTTTLYVAHPLRRGLVWNQGPQPGIDGLEVLNMPSLGQLAWRKQPLSVLWSLLIYPFNERLSFLRLYQNPDEEVALWDKWNEKGVYKGYAGVEATARAMPWAGKILKFPAYEQSFETLSNHLLLTSELTGQYLKDRGKILQALKTGSFYFSIDLLGDPRGFVSFLDSEGQTWPMGSVLKLKKKLKLMAALPQKPQLPFEIIIFKNGERLKNFNTRKVEYEIKEPGVYRVLVRLRLRLPFPDGSRWFNWIYSNPFWVQ